MISPAELDVFAQRCRAALDSLPREQRTDLPGVALRDFPRGACGPVSTLVGQFLIERFRTECQYIFGDAQHPGRDARWTHAWLEVDGLIVDITHDQFKGTGLTGWVFDRSIWHAQFSRLEFEMCATPMSETWPTGVPRAEYDAIRLALAAG